MRKHFKAERRHRRSRVRSLGRGQARQSVLSRLRVERLVDETAKSFGIRQVTRLVEVPVVGAGRSRYADDGGRGCCRHSRLVGATLG